MYKKITKVLLLLLLFSQTYIFIYAEDKRVLFISSYHPSFPTFFEQVNGIRDVLSNEDVVLDIEFMDSKRFFDSDVQDRFFELLKVKIGKLQPYDGVITSDDNALRFAVKNQNILFPNTPIIFCGVNNVEYAISMDRNSYITGFVEDTSMEETIDLITELHNESNKLYLITDSTTSGQADLQKITDIIYTNYNLGLEVLDLSNLSFKEFSYKLDNIPIEQPVLLLSLYKDSLGIVTTFNQGLELILKHLKAPLYHLWFHGLGDGIVGGKLISHYEQGKSAATLLLDILQGYVGIESTLVNRVSPNVFYFDDIVLKKFLIKHKQLPEDSVIINRKTSILNINSFTIISGLIIISLLLFVILLLVKNGRVKRALIKEHSGVISYITNILNSIDVGIITIDKKFNVIRENDYVLYILDEVRLESDTTNVFSIYPFLEKYAGMITSGETQSLEDEVIEFISDRFLRISVNALEGDIESGSLIKLEDVTKEVVSKKKEL